MTGVLAPGAFSSKQVTLKTEFCCTQLLPGSSNRVGGQFIDISTLESENDNG